MNKIKINSGLASVLIVASFFVGWQALLLVVLFILLFCELNDTIKGVMIKILSFFIGLSLFQMAWNLIVNAYPVVVDTINNFVEVINCYVDDPISLGNLQAYLLEPIQIILNTADSIVGYVIVLVKFMFVISLLGNKVMKENFITKFVNKFIDKVINFVNGLELGKMDINNPEVKVQTARPQIINTPSENAGMPLGNMPEKPTEGPKPTMDVPPQAPANPVHDNNDKN